MRPLDPETRQRDLSTLVHMNEMCVASLFLTTRQIQHNASSSSQNTGKWYARANSQMHSILVLSKTHCSWVSNHAPDFSAIPSRSRDIEKESRVRTCRNRCCPLFTCVKRLANLSLNTGQMSAQSVQAALEIRKRGYICTCACAHVRIYPTHDLCHTHQYLVSNHTPNLVTIDQKLLSCFSATHSGPLHAARATCQAGLTIRNNR